MENCHIHAVQSVFMIPAHINLYPGAHKLPIIVHKVNSESIKVNFYQN